MPSGGAPAGRTNRRAAARTNAFSTALSGTPQLQKLRDRFLAAPTESATLQDLCKNELKTKKHTATEGLIWLNR